MVNRVFYSDRVKQITKRSNQRAPLEIRKLHYSLKLENDGLIKDFTLRKFNSKRTIFIQVCITLQLSYKTKSNFLTCLLAKFYVFNVYIAMITR